MFPALWKWWGKTLMASQRQAAQSRQTDASSSDVGDGEEDAHRMVLASNQSNLDYALECIRLLEMEKDTIRLRVERRSSSEHK